MRDAVTAKGMCKIVDFARNCELKTVAICFTTDGNGSCHGLAPSFFDDMTHCRHQSLAGDDQATLMVDRNSTAIDMCPDSRPLWNRMNSLLRLVASTSVTHTADDFSTFFTRKVDTIHATTATAPAPTIEHRQVPPLASSNNVTMEEVSRILRKRRTSSANLTRC